MLAAGALLLATACSSGETPSGPIIPPVTVPGGNTGFTVPDISREFRGLWIATVANIDWPSRSGLSPAAQQAELVAILDRAQSARMNAVVLQVRAAGDAIFPSSLEPWARSLTGTQGVDPGWDPLAFAVGAAHDRGLELHAWFNPFRAGNASDTVRLAPLHFAARNPSLRRLYCGSLWFEPSSGAVQDQAINVVRDVIRRYNVDAVHIDDFFYPYPVSSCPGLDFPDAPEYAAYQAGGGTLSRGDWRRDNVNRFVERLYTEAHAERRTVRVGISPFGIWRPGNPAGIVGLDAYASIYADSRLWLQRGWADYFAPQLYWSTASTGQNYQALLDWWTSQNTLRRHLWPGLAAYRVSDGTTSAYRASEIAAQIGIARQRALVAGGPTGSILYNTTSVMQDRDGLSTLLSGSVFTSAALTPPSPWLDATAPAQPTLAVTTTGNGATLRVTIAGIAGDELAWWLIRWRSGTTWSQRLVPANNFTADIAATSAGTATDAIVVNAVDRAGNASTDAIWRR